MPKRAWGVLLLGTVVSVCSHRAIAQQAGNADDLKTLAVMCLAATPRASGSGSPPASPTGVVGMLLPGKGFQTMAVEGVVPTAAGPTGALRLRSGP